MFTKPIDNICGLGLQFLELYSSIVKCLLFELKNIPCYRYKEKYASDSFLYILISILLCCTCFQPLLISIHNYQ